MGWRMGLVSPKRKNQLPAAIEKVAGSSFRCCYEKHIHTNVVLIKSTKRFVHENASSQFVCFVIQPTVYCPSVDLARFSSVDLKPSS